MDQDRKQDLNTKFEQFTKIMKNKSNFKFLGNGLYARVYQKEGSNDVVKVFAYDDSYVKYLGLIFKHREQKAFPVIKRYDRFMGKLEGLHIVKMESLYPVMVEEFQDNQDIKNIINYFHNKAPNKPNKGPHGYLATAALLIKTTANHDPLISIDMHADNIMKRDNGEFVIIDPFCPSRLGMQNA